MNQTPVCTAADAIYRLAAGNLKYLNAESGNGDISRRVRLATWAKGQSPYAIIVTCSDSRVIPENIFSAGIGELFVIRLAGNVIDDHQLGSIEYAAGHLGCRLVVVLGHTHCGAVDAAINSEPAGYIRCITDEIKKAIGDETDPYKASCLNVRHSVHEGNETITGENFTTSDKYEWGLMVDSTYGHYVVRISGPYLFHSVPYFSATGSSLETEEYNKLGSVASLGCIRMAVRDVKWIYDNCPAGTKVTIYDDAANPGPLGKPESIKIPVNSPNAGWDPTDTDPANPWLKNSAAITGAADITVKVGEKANLKANVHATDTCGNDITSKIITIGHYTFDQVGEYDIKYKVTDAIGSVDEKTVKLKVVE